MNISPALRDRGPSQETGVESAPANRSWLRQFGHDVLFVVGGWASSLAIGSLLASMFFSSILLLPVALLGVVLLPLILIGAGFGADLTRLRYNAWRGRDELPLLTPRPSFTSFGDYLRTCLDLRLWLDLLYEMVAGALVRVISMVVLITWAGLGAGLSLAWLPAVLGYGNPDHATLSYRIASHLGIEPWGYLSGLWGLVDALGFLAIGLVILATLPVGLKLAARIEGWFSSMQLRGRTFADMRVQGWATSAALHVALVSWFLISAGSSPSYPAGDWLIVLGLLMCAGMVLATRWPLIGASLSVGAFAVSSVLCIVVTYLGTMGGGFWPLTVLISVVFAFLFLFLAAKRATAVAISTFGAMVAVTGLTLAMRVVVGWGIAEGWGFGGLLPDLILFLVSAVGWIGALAGGFGLRSLADSARTAAFDRAAREEAELQRIRAQHESAESQRRNSELDERARIAREMHDVVAHSMSLISVQAQSAPYRLTQSNLDAATKEEFASIAATSRSALTEMRGLLTVLRGAPAPAGSGGGADDGAQRSELETAPQPTLGDVPQLVETSRRSGADVELRMEVGSDEGVLLPPMASLTLYRAAQEGISNALRHAPGAPITLTVTDEADAIRLSVVNPAAATPVTRPASPGYGLRGIRERVSALGGVVHTRKGEDGSFTLEVSIPHQ